MTLPTPKPPKVSIVITAYNAERYIQACVSAALGVLSSWSCPRLEESLHF